MMRNQMFKALLLFLVACGSSAIQISVNIKKPGPRVSPYYHSVTLDTSVLSVPGKLQKIIFNQRVRTLAKGLSPAYLRVGGTTANSLYFCESRQSCNLPKQQNGSIIITGQDWKDLLKFSQDLSLKLNFDLNALPRNPDGTWNSSNSESLIRFSKEQNMTSPDWQIGNELNLNNALAGDKLAQAYNRFRKVLDCAGGSYAQSSLVGPEVSGMNLAATQSFVGSFLKMNPPVNIVSTHHYYFNGRTANLSSYIDPSIMDTLGRDILDFKTFVYSVKANIPIWISETSAGYNGGTLGVSERFAAGFLWLDKLGMAALSGISLVARQALANCSTYCLINETFDPIPDYWLSLLYKKLVGQTVLQVNKSSSDNSIRIYAHCSRTDSSPYKEGSVTIFGLNVRNESVQVSLPNEFLNSIVDQYILTGSDNGKLLSQYPALNGKGLFLLDDKTLPPLNPVRQNAASGLNFPPYSLAFFVFPQINAPACQ